MRTFEVGKIKAPGVARGSRRENLQGGFNSRPAHCWEIKIIPDTRRNDT